MKFKNAKFIDTVTYQLSFEMGERLNDKFCAYPKTGPVTDETWIPTQCLNAFNKNNSNLYAYDVSTGFDGNANFRIEVLMDADKARPIQEVKKLVLDHLNEWVKVHL